MRREDLFSRAMFGLAGLVIEDVGPINNPPPNNFFPSLIGLLMFSVLLSVALVHCPDFSVVSLVVVSSWLIGALTGFLLASRIYNHGGAKWD